MRRRQLVPAAAALVLACIGAASAGAEVQLSGNPDKLMLRVKDASLPEIVSALRSALHVEIEITGSNARQFAGVYAGSMRRVLSRLLQATDYIIEPTDDGLRVRIVSIGAARSAAARATAADEATALASLSAAAAGSAGSRASRIRRQRTAIQPQTGDDRQ
jgi:hypothetical protein